jgi:hypothetical protein
MLEERNGETIKKHGLGGQQSNLFYEIRKKIARINKATKNKLKQNNLRLK